jgi:hypothetical protein
MATKDRPLTEEQKARILRTRIVYGAQLAFAFAGLIELIGVDSPDGDLRRAGLCFAIAIPPAIVLWFAYAVRVALEEEKGWRIVVGKLVNALVAVTLYGASLSAGFFLARHVSDDAARAYIAANQRAAA